MARILVVDDSDDLREFLSVLLKIRNFTVEVASSKKELETKLLQFVPDVILLDVRLGGEDGRELCREIKTKTPYKHIPIILLSASPQLLNDYAECEANDIIEKPFQITVLLEKINTQLKKASYHNANQ